MERRSLSSHGTSLYHESCGNSFPQGSVALSKTNVIRLEDRRLESLVAQVTSAVTAVNYAPTLKDNGEEHYVCRCYNTTFITSLLSSHLKEDKPFMSGMQPARSMKMNLTMFNLLCDVFSVTKVPLATLRKALSYASLDIL